MRSAAEQKLAAGETRVALDEEEGVLYAFKV